VLVTDDGGTTWALRHVPVDLQGISGVSCTTNSDCIGVGSQLPPSGNVASDAAIVSTTDGGLSWVMQNVPNDTAVAQLDSVSCSSVADCTAAGASSSGLLVVETTSDAGQTWASQKVPSLPVYLGGVASSPLGITQVVGSGSAGAFALGRRLKT
jgi:photosystem II stability/assembly factor-like uncharacterized protein